MIRLAYTIDREPVRLFLQKAGRPAPLHSAEFLIETDQSNEIVAVIALDMFATDGWLRSLVVDPKKWRAQRMVPFFLAVFQEAKRKSLDTLYLQTHGFEPLLLLLGFQEIPLNDVPVDIRRQMVISNPDKKAAMCIKIKDLA